MDFLPLYFLFSFESMNPKILIVEDEQNLGFSIQKGLNELGFAAFYTDSALEALEKMQTEKFDVIVSDIVMPNMSGHEFIKAIRQKGIETPLLFLTALGSTDEKVSGFELGADDYLTKPFEFRELVARLKALLKRSAFEERDEILSCEDLILDVHKKKVVRNNLEIHLTQREFDLLVYFLRNKDRIVSKAELVEKVWGLHFDPGTNVIEVYINYLRNKINKGHNRKMVETVHGQGYRLRGTHAD